MNTEDTKERLSKHKAAVQQIHAAIDHCEKGELAPAITLAAAAENMLPATEKDHLIKRINDLGLFKQLDMNAVINWLKHDTDYQTVEIQELEAGATIMRAISKFVAVLDGITPKMKAFHGWMIKRGHFAKEADPKTAK
jgi:hypothetical protein